nr:immunoglobulin heavy chain junction region [Mus musculus]MBK4195217.1 immunoglobulin heavy chain junction region [Mus musculus]
CVRDGLQNAMDYW